MQNYNSHRKVSGVIRYSCAFLFMLFSFCYLYFLQGDLLAEAQYVYSHGLTTYSLFFGALVLTIILQIVQVVVSCIVSFHAPYYSLSYYLPLLSLALITNITRSDLHSMICSWCLWLSILSLPIYFYVLYVLRTRVGSGKPMLNIMWNNYLILFIMILCCGAIPRTHEVLHYELAVERRVIEHRYDDALRVASQSLHSSRRLTELRMFALAQSGQLADRLFDYPQYYKGRGLLCITDIDSTYRYSPQRICYALGAVPGTSFHSTIKYLKHINSVDSLRTPTTQNYQLCYYLLDRNLPAFRRDLLWFYPVATNPVLPRNYSEAVLYMNNVLGDNLPYQIPQDIVDRYQQYQQRKSEITDSIPRRNYLRREFSTTFWWYYEREEIVDN